MQRSLDVLHFSTADVEGGSARSAWRIHNGLLARGHRSHLLVRSKTSGSDLVRSVANGRFARFADRCADVVGQISGWQYLYVPSSGRLPRDPWVRGADLIQLYNTHGGYFSHRLLPLIVGDRPLVWRLSDLWPLTGHCAYPGDCERWRNGCGDCPNLESYPPVVRDTTHFLWDLKRDIYSKICRLVMVAPSSWTERLVRESPLFTGREVVRIPNGLDLTCFRPGDRGAARRRFGLPDDKVLLMFNAHVAADNPRKGTHLLIDALKALPNPEQVGLLVAGQGAEWWCGKVPQSVYPLGFLQSDEAIRDAYVAADMVVLPSTVENLPNSLLESMACGIPAVAFDVGGMRDAVVDGETGCLICAGDVPAFCSAMGSMVRNRSVRMDMGAASRVLAEREFDERVEAARFEALYLGLLAGGAS